MQTFIFSLVFLVIFHISESSPPYQKYGYGYGHGHGRGRQRHRSGHCDEGVSHESQQNPNPPIYGSDPQPQFEASPPYQVSEGPPPPMIPPQNGYRQTSQPPQLEDGGGLQLFPPGSGPDENPESTGISTCPQGSGIYKKTGMCYKFVNHFPSTGEVSPCGPFMDFYKNSTDPLYGECDCKDQHLGITRPIAYWERTDQCYWLFDQGPCSVGEWLVLNDNGVPICSNRSCPENLPEDWSPTENRRKYWFRQRGKCFKSESTGFCEKPEESIYLVFKEQRYTTECKTQVIDTKTLLNGAKPLPCRPGHKESASGECRRIATFE